MLAQSIMHEEADVAAAEVEHNVERICAVQLAIILQGLCYHKNIQTLTFNTFIDIKLILRLDILKMHLKR
jgi:hypothetical protein